MFRRATFRFEPAVAALAVDPQLKKMQTLHKILTGEVQFKNKALVKECNVELMFGANWKTEAAAYAKGLKKAEAEIFARQIARLSLTRYTTRELAQYAANGPALVDETAKASQIADGSRLLREVGDAEFTKIVQAEAKSANWSEKEANQFIADVKGKK